MGGKGEWDMSKYLDDSTRASDPGGDAVAGRGNVYIGNIGFDFADSEVSPARASPTVTEWITIETHLSGTLRPT